MLTYAKPWSEQSMLERMVTAVELVRDRMERVTAALDAAGVPYAVVGGNAVAAWVTTVDKSAVRNTRDVDVLLRRGDLEAAKQAVAEAGFSHYQLSGIDMFLDGPTAGPKEAVHLLFANEKVRDKDAVTTPDVIDASRPEGFSVISLESLLRMKLTSYRDKDRTHVRDLLDVGLIDATWTERYPPDLAARLQHIIDTPEG